MTSEKLFRGTGIRCSPLLLLPEQRLHLCSMLSPLEIEGNNDIAMEYESNLTRNRPDEADTLLQSAHSVNREIDTSITHRRWIVTSLVVVVLVFVSVIQFAKDDENVPKSKTITVELEGKHKKKKKKEKNKDVFDDSLSDDQQTTCTDGRYAKHTLKRAYELPFAALFRDHKGQRKYEASSVIVVNDSAYAVCDSSWAISKFDVHLTPFSTRNVQIGSVNREIDDSGYEAFFHENGIFYVVRESVQHDDEKYYAIVEELDLTEPDYSVVNKCSTEYNFEGDSKGFEGAITIRDLNNEMIILGLCEGNHCSETHKNEAGNGRLVAMRKTIEVLPNRKSRCTWTTIRMINIPSSAYFKDYSGITMDDSGKVGISSQENSQFWVGQLLGKDNTTGLWDIDEVEFDLKDAKVYDFPKNDNCETIYCNVEGVHWLKDDMIIAVSDKMKGRGKQDFICHDKDQSVHVFVLPE
jgi:hypothetical protein